MVAKQLIFVNKVFAMSFEASVQSARKLDRKDTLRKFRKQFFFPKHKGKKAVYFCGNSLGLQSKNVGSAIAQELADWKRLAVNGYFSAGNPWLHYQDLFREPLAKIMGCRPMEVTVMNTLTVNLHLLLFSFYRPAGQRCKIMMEAGAFPSDQYAVETQVRFHGYDPANAIIEISPREREKTIGTDVILEAIDKNKNELALVLFGGINYYTGQLFDIRAITAAAHKAGALAGFDLAHTAGNVPMQLHDWSVDFAAWCSYKYLNGGPGAAGGIYVHEQYANDIHYPRLGGWWGNDEKTRFKMEKGFVPQAGAGGWQMSTAQVLNMAALKASLELFDTAGIQALRKKSRQLTAYLAFLMNRLKHLDFEIITPQTPEQRGAQLSLYFKEKGEIIHKRLTENGVIADYREPGVIRVAPAPLYNSFEDVYRFYEVLKNC
jgi:kynureninase